MINIIPFFRSIKSFSWILFLLTGTFTLVVHQGCKEEAVTPDMNMSIDTRGDRDGEPLDVFGNACLPDSILYCDSIPTNDSLWFSLADYPGCSFLITYEYYECRVDSSQFYHIGSFELVYHNCSAFATAFSNAYTAGGATLAAFVENFDHDVFLQIKKALANMFVTSGTYPCNTNPATFISYIRVSCYKWCYVDNGQTVSSTKIACGTDCCSEYTTACRDEGDNLVIQTASSSAYYPYCDGPTIFGTGAPPGRCDSESACDFDCPEE